MRAPLSIRKQAERAAARARIAARTEQGVSAALKEQDHLDHRHRPRQTVLAALASLASSTAVHAALIGVGFVVGGIGQAAKKSSTATKIEVRERLPEPPPPPPPPPEPEPVAAQPPPKPVKPVETKPEPEPEPVEPTPTPTKPPPRVTGLSLESTTQGGSGPKFGTGNTREGKAADVAVDPKSLAPVPPGPATPEPPRNQQATRIPTAGVKYVLPQRKQPAKPTYPETLKSQGIEADVTVMVNLDATGKVIKVKIIKKAPYPEFDEAAYAAAMAEQFEPATKDGVAIPYTLSFTYRFRLEDQ